MGGIVTRELAPCVSKNDQTGRFTRSASLLLYVVRGRNKGAMMLGDLVGVGTQSTGVRIDEHLTRLRLAFCDQRLPR